MAGVPQKALAHWNFSGATLDLCPGLPPFAINAACCRSSPAARARWKFRTTCMLVSLALGITSETRILSFGCVDPLLQLVGQDERQIGHYVSVAQGMRQIDDFSIGGIGAHDQDGLHLPYRPLVDLYEGPGGEIVQARLQVPPVNLAEKATVADRIGWYGCETAAQEKAEQQCPEHQAHRRGRRNDAHNETTTGQAALYLSPQSGERSDIQNQVLPTAAERARPETPDD